MKRKYHISLNIIVPLIFSALSLLSSVIAYELTMYALSTGRDSMLYLTIWAIVVTGGTFAAGVLISRIILKPIEQFVEQAERHPAMQAADQEKGRKDGDQILRFTSVVDQIADLMGKVEARELFPEIIGQSKPIRRVLSQILKVAPTDATVLITGESGTGKELVSASILKHSKRQNKPFVAVNCAAIPQGLLESELFGHEKGAFTGADSMKRGKFEVAHEGTLFLDEIGDMPQETQAKILRALELGVCERVGGSRPIRFDVRLIAATNKDFQKMIEKGEFREDLYHRLNVFPILIPPLRERREDIALLAQYFLERFNKELQLTSEALQLLMSSPWPGNVRELRNVMERAAVLGSKDRVIEPRHLSGHVLDRSMPSDVEELPDGVSLDQQLEEMEKAMILAALAKTGGVQARAAELLGVKVRSLWHRIKKYDINVQVMKN
ncbi:MAG: sigma-54-dependent Fis family transcriptional regulator [Desulfovibrio sp.]|nr:MAG: sigma-54-dependent Fis family transcriptional regulator [Desulfovibrio sp.]